MYSWGRGEGLQLGLSRKTIEDMEDIEMGVSTPTPIIKDKTIVDVAAGVAHSIALTDDGQVY